MVLSPPRPDEVVVARAGSPGRLRDNLSRRRGLARPATPGSSAGAAGAHPNGRCRANTRPLRGSIYPSQQMDRWPIADARETAESRRFRPFAGRASHRGEDANSLPKRPVERLCGSQYDRARKDGPTGPFRDEPCLTARWADLQQTITKLENEGAALRRETLASRPARYRDAPPRGDRAAHGGRGPRSATRNLQRDRAPCSTPRSRPVLPL